MCIVSLGLFALSTQAQGPAQVVEFHQSVDRTDVSTDDTFHLTVVVDGASMGVVPTFPTSKDFRVLSSADTVQMSYSPGGGAGAIRGVHHYVLSLRANHAGRLTLPASVLVTLDKTYRTDPVEMSVRPGDLAHPKAPPSREWPTCHPGRFVARDTGFEPVAFGSGGQRSIQLS
jgi:hypothetical protein